MTDKSRFAKYAQFVKFNLVGLLNTALDYALFSLQVWLGVPYLLAQCVSYMAGVANSYYLNKIWTFGSREAASSGQAARFLVVNAVTLGLSLLLLYVAKDRLGMNEFLAKAAVTIVTMLVNFAGNKLWVFRPSASRPR